MEGSAGSRTLKIMPRMMWAIPSPGEITAKLNGEQRRTKSQEAETHTEADHSKDVLERWLSQNAPGNGSFSVSWEDV